MADTVKAIRAMYREVDAALEGVETLQTLLESTISVLVAQDPLRSSWANSVVSKVRRTGAEDLIKAWAAYDEAKHDPDISKPSDRGARAQERLRSAEEAYRHAFERSLLWKK